MTGAQKKFEGLLSRYFERYLEENPTFATAYAGLRDGEGKLEAWSPQFVQGQEKQRQKTWRALDEVSPQELTGEQQLDRLALRAHLLRECEDFDRGRHTLEPSGPSHLLNILLHELMRGDDEPARAARNLRSLLKAAPDFLRQGARLIRKPEAVWLRVMEQSAAGAPLLLEGIRAFLLRTAPRDTDEANIRTTQQALEKYRDRAKRKPVAKQGSFAIGAIRLQRRVRDELGLDYSLGQVEALALGEVARVRSLLQDAARKYGKSPDQVLIKFREQWRPGKPLLELYQSETRRVADNFRRARALTFPEGDELIVKEVPEFLRNVIPTAAYTQPGAFQRRQRGVFWVNDLSVTKTRPEEKLAEQRQHFGIPLTCAHEAYPGHHLQFVTANRHPRKWRRLFAHAVFFEGWTLWCEQMMVDLKIVSSPWLQLQQLHDALWRCHRILVDLRLQTCRYGYCQAVAHMQKHLGFTQARAEADVNWYTASPAVPMSYWLGRLENERLRQRLIAGRGWSLRKFNDWLLSFGTLPQSWLEKYGLD